MNEEMLLQRRERTHAIVEGALLGDIAIVFLLMRAYLPILFVRPIFAAVAAVPFVMLTQRRGVKIMLLSAAASYILFSALVGPLLALRAVDVAVAGLLIGVGRRIGFGPALNTLLAGPVYGFLDYVVPTILSIIIFRFPIHDLIKAAQNAVNLVFHLVQYFLTRFHAPASVHHQVQGMAHTAAGHWQIVILVVLVLQGVLNIYLAALVSELVLKQIPEQTLARRMAA
jgi:Predicted membrane protein (DUF2232)